MTPIPPVNHHVDVACDFPQTLLVMAPDTDGSSRNTVDVIREFSADVLAVGSPPYVGSLRPDLGGVGGLRRSGWGVLCTGLHDECGGTKG